MSYRDFMFYLFWGIIDLFVINLFVMVRWPKWYFGKKSKKKR